MAITVPQFEIDDTVTVLVNDETHTGWVTNVDKYGETTAVERVVSIRYTFKHEVEGEEGWVPWKGYLIEEPAGEFRFNLLKTDGQGIRTKNLGEIQDAHSA